MPSISSIRRCCRWRCCHLRFRRLSHLAPLAWMIVFGDGLHNLMDGLSIGVAFRERIGAGLSVSLGILCEELPHELGV
ncbi:unnamed protein product [Protopolystoma xenopodis]|uniref:Uncharacterized protein n=1 Tax=Protopolystoma xenopodis TaxID=117903 RepID=A0A3S5BL48_9PLAT|nr:unnamed protein product [Protopolystoma xenopodis]